MFVGDKMMVCLALIDHGMTPVTALMPGHLERPAILTDMRTLLTYLESGVLILQPHSPEGITCIYIECTQEIQKYVKGIVKKGGIY